MTRSTSLVATALVAVVVGSLVAVADAQERAGEEHALHVTVKYGGKGQVDATHKIWVWLFSSPEITPQAVPIAQQALEKNGATASFSKLRGEQVYLVIAFDEKGGFAGSGPPPSGSPLIFHGAKGPGDPPAPVVLRSTSRLTVTFDDRRRMN